MKPESTQPDHNLPWVKLLEVSTEYEFGDLFRVDQARLQYRLYDGHMSNPITRINFERGDSVGVLLYNPGAQEVILVRQFRYPVYTTLDEQSRRGDGARQAWLLEIIAGVIEAGRSVVSVAHSELIEEAGYKVKDDLSLIATFFVSPGGTSERIHLFFGEVDAAQQVEQGGGLKAEGEDTQVVALPFARALKMVEDGEIQDAKTIIALQHLALQRSGQAV